MLSYFEILDADKEILLNAYAANTKDVEDCVQYFVALKHHDIKYFVTRNIIDYKAIAVKELPIIKPNQLIDFI